MAGAVPVHTCAPVRLPRAAYPSTIHHMMNYSGACAQCGRSLPARSGPGRPRRYCGRRCSSAAERERMARRLLLGALVEQRTLNEEDGNG
ncbi:hypothetical protein JCM4020_23530 [Streptomyces coelicolor]|nr:hypothetical protein JCM4020_23530 [Streptomyces coelicolor]